MDPGGQAQQYRYQPSNQPQQKASAPDLSAPQVEWHASEFIDHQKSLSWFLMLGVGAVVGSFLMYVITRSIISTVVVLLSVAVFAMIAKQKPRTLHYILRARTVQIGDKSYNYDDFRAFSVNHETGLPSITLQPIKRFIPLITIYFAPDDGEKIFDVFAQHLPHEERNDDAVERLMRKIRF